MIPELAGAASSAADRGNHRALRRQRAMSRKLDLGRAVEIGFRLAGWGAGTLLATGGLFVLVFVALGNFTLEGFFLQLANLADRYGTADAARRAAFAGDLLLAGCIALGLAAVFRRGSLRQVFSTRAGE